MYVNKEHQLLEWPNKFIFVRESDPHTMIGGLFHETAHYLCENNSLYNDFISREYYAYKHELETSLELGFNIALMLSMKSIEASVSDEDFDLDYRLVFQAVMQDPLWKKCDSHLKEKGY